MNTNKKGNQELVSLNSELSEFDVKELEQRLETDPLAVGGLLDVTSASDFLCCLLLQVVNTIVSLIFNKVVRVFQNLIFGKMNFLFKI